MKSKNGGKTLKSILLTMFLVVGCCLAAFAAKPADQVTNGPGDSVDVSASTPDTGTTPQATACDAIVAAMTVVPRTRESVGTAVLNTTKAYALQPKTELEGFTRVALKPKIRIDFLIEQTLGFSGLGRNHFARADV